MFSDLKLNIKKRRDNRILALMLIFNILILKIKKQDVREYIFENSEIAIENTYAEEIINGVVNEKENLIKKLQPFLKEDWSFDRLDLQDQTILLIASWEILYNKVPKKIVINEALEITKQFSEEISKKYINAVLDKLKGE